MSARRKIKFTLAAVCAIKALFASYSTALAQCAMCRTGVASSPEAAKLAESLNLAIIVLLIPPVLIFCGIFYAVLRQRKPRETASLKVSPERRPSWPEKLNLRRKSKDGKRRESDGALA
jgi:hypothetical protein